MGNCSSRSPDPFHAQVWGQGLPCRAVTTMYQLTFRDLVSDTFPQWTTAHLQLSLPILGSMK